MQVNDINELLTMATKQNISDILLVPENPPILKFSDRTTEYGGTDLTAEEIKSFATHVLASYYEDFDTIDNIRSKHFSYQLKDVGRFRISLFKSRFNLCLSIRVIPVEIRSFTDLNLPKQITSIAQQQRGLVLITGATGQGKSTTISAIIEEINRTRRTHIITIEDPIEFTYEQGKSIIIQRELGVDTTTLAQALDETLRHSPNVIMIGEIRDKETFEGVLTLAETGHLVISSIHTSDAKTTILRILDYYPEAQRQSVRNRLANSLKVIASQRLVRTAATQIPDRVPVCEILQVNSAVADSIRTFDKLDDIKSYMERGGDYYGMQTFDQHLIQLLNSRVIDLNTALAYANSPSEVQREYALEGNELE